MDETVRDIKIFSFFSGSGFLDLGFEKAGYKVELVNEYYKPFIEAYQYSRNKMGLRKPEYGYHQIDINKFLSDYEDELKSYISKARVDKSTIGFIGGPPCPDFSIAGKNKGKDGENGKLSLSYVKLIIKMKPDFFLFENVKGLWKTARHRAFYEELKKKLESAGYATTERLTNALEFGVPQDRDRILLFGVRKALLPRKSVLKNKITDFNWEIKKEYCLETVKTAKWPTTSRFVESGTLDAPSDIIQPLTVEYWFRQNNVEKHPNAKDYFTPKKGLPKMLTVEEGDVSRKSYKRLHRWRYSPTVAYGNNEVHLHPYYPRRLAVSEALAIQSLPEEFVLPYKMSLSDKFKTVGNGVPYMLSFNIANTLKIYLNEKIKLPEDKLI